jgi:hypothetical protein
MQMAGFALLLTGIYLAAQSEKREATAEAASEH